MVVSIRACGSELPGPARGRNVLASGVTMAYVDGFAEGNLMQFAETIAVDRGARGAVLRTVEQAESWAAARITEANRA